MSRRHSFPLWREIVIPQHTGGEDLVAQVTKGGAVIERWAGQMVRAAVIPPRTEAIAFRVARVSNTALGLQRPRSTIVETKTAGRKAGLSFLSLEDVLALRLAYADQPPEWMRVAMETYVDEDGSHLDLAVVNDGQRRDIRTTWGFPENVFQHRHEWFWKLPE